MSHEQAIDGFLTHTSVRLDAKQLIALASLAESLLLTDTAVALVTLAYERLDEDFTVPVKTLGKATLR